MIKPKITYVIGEKEKTVGPFQFRYFCDGENKIYVGYESDTFSELTFNKKIDSICIKNMKFDKQLACHCKSNHTKVIFKDCEFNSGFLSLYDGNYQLIRPRFLTPTSISVDGKSFEMNLLKHDESSINGKIAASNILLTNIKAGSIYSFDGKNISLINSHVSALSRVKADQIYVNGMMGNSERVSMSAKSLTVRNSEFSMKDSQMQYQNIGLQNSSIILEGNSKFNNITVQGDQPLTVTEHTIEGITAHSNVVAVLKGIQQQVAEQAEQEKRNRSAAHREIYEAAKISAGSVYKREIETLDEMLNATVDDIGARVDRQKVKELIPGKKR